VDRITRFFLRKHRYDPEISGKSAYFFANKVGNYNNALTDSQGYTRIHNILADEKLFADYHIAVLPHLLKQKPWGLFER